MNPFLAAILLGIIQGLTEFLPVSSSGHLAIAEHVFGFGPRLYLTALLHMGTLAAVLLVFREDLGSMVRDSFFALRETLCGRSVTPWRDRRGARLTWLVLLATVPTGIIGLGLESAWQGLAANVALVCVMLLVTAVLLWITRTHSDGGDELTAKTALLLGVVQGLAVMPGISRSGSTIALALLLGLSRREAGRFSFLMSVPAVAGAGLLELRHISGLAGRDILAASLGTLVSFVVGYFALKGLIRWVERGKLHLFAWYLLAVGGLGLAWSFLFS